MAILKKNLEKLLVLFIYKDKIKIKTCKAINFAFIKR